MGCAPATAGVRWSRPEPDAGSNPVLKWLAAAAATGVVLPLALVLLVTANPATSVAGTSTADGPSVLALTDIPPTYLAWYMGAARTCPGLPWGVLAGIGKVESDHG